MDFVKLIEENLPFEADIPELINFTNYYSDYICVKIPDVTITNSVYLNSMFLGDCYVFIDLDTFYFTLMRDAISLAERNSGYIHSHIRSIDYSRKTIIAGDYCLGNTVTAMLRMELSEDYSDEAFLAYIALISDVIGTESEEGGPYKRIRNLNTENYVDTTHIDFPYLISIVDDLEISRISDPLLKIQVLHTEENARRLGAHLIKYYPECVGNTFNNGVVSNPIVSAENNHIDLFIFKDNLVTLEIKDNETTTNDKFVSYEQITQINRQLDWWFQEYYVKKAVYNRRQLAS